MSTRYGLDRAFTALVTVAALVGIVVLAVLLVDVIRDGSSMLSLEFLTSFPSQIFPENGGIYPALVGSLWLLGLTALISVPLGLGAAVYLEEYAEDTRINRIIEINISNLAGVPSVIYGLLGLGIFVQLSGAGHRRRERAHRRADVELLDPAGHHRRDQGGAAGHPRLDPGGRVRARGDEVGGDLEPPAPDGAAWRSHGHHPGALAGHRRGGPDPRRRGLAVPDVRHRRAVRRLHGAAHPDLRLDQPPAADLPGLRRGRHRGGNGGAACWRTRSRSGCGTGTSSAREWRFTQRERC